MFCPVFTSHSVGGFFPSLTMFRLGVCPHIVWSSADAGRETVERQRAAAAARRTAGWRGFMVFFFRGYDSRPVGRLGRAASSLAHVLIAEGGGEGSCGARGTLRTAPHPALSPLSTRGRGFI